MHGGNLNLCKAVNWIQLTHTQDQLWVLISCKAGHFLTS